VVYYPNRRGPSARRNPPRGRSRSSFSSTGHDFAATLVLLGDAAQACNHRHPTCSQPAPTADMDATLLRVL